MIVKLPLWVSRVLKYPKKLLEDSTTFFMSTWWGDPKNIKESVRETLAILNNFSYDRDLVEDTIEITIQIADICRRYNLLPDVDSQTLGERRESIEKFEDSVIDDLNKVLIPSSTNITTGNTLEKFLGKKGKESDDEKLNFMDDHVSKIGLSLIHIWRCRRRG